MNPVSLGVSAAVVAAFGILATATLAWCAAATVGAASVLIHERDTPETLADWALWACRGIAYVTGAALGGAFGVYTVVGDARLSAFVAVVIAFALVAHHMRTTTHTARGENGAT